MRNGWDWLSWSQWSQEMSSATAGNLCAEQHTLGDSIKGRSKFSLRQDSVEQNSLENRNKQNSAHHEKQKHAGPAHVCYTSTSLMQSAQTEAAKWSWRLFLIKRYQTIPGWDTYGDIYIYICIFQQDLLEGEK